MITQSTSDDAPLKVYIVSSLLNADRVRSIRDKLKPFGVEVSYDWTTHGQIYDEDGKEAAALGELGGIDDAGCILVIFPCRCGSHFEMGYALNKKPIIILNDVGVPYDVSFHSLRQLIKCTAEEEAISRVLDVLKKK